MHACNSLSVPTVCASSLSSFKQSRSWYTRSSLIQQYVLIKASNKGRNHLICKSYVPNSLRHKHSEAWGKYKLDRAIQFCKSVACRASLAMFLKMNQEYHTFGTCSQRADEKLLVARMKESPKLFHLYIHHKKQFCATVGHSGFLVGSCQIIW